MKVIKCILIFINSFNCFAQGICDTIKNDFSVPQKMDQAAFSEEGTWFAYTKSGAKDSLFLVDTRNGKQQIFDRVSSFSFLDSDRLVLNRDDGTMLFDVKTKQAKWFDLKEYSVWHGSEGQLWKQADKIGYTSVKGKNRRIISHVSFFQLHPSIKRGVFSRVLSDSTFVYALDLDNWKQQELVRFNGKLKKVVFNTHDDRFVLATGMEDGNIQLFASERKDHQKDMKTVTVNDIGVNSIAIDSGNAKIYFNALGAPKVVNNKTISVLSSLDNEFVEVSNMRMVWDTNNGEVYELSDPDYSDIIASAHPNRYIAIKTSPYDPKEHGGLSYADFYLIGNGINPKLIETKVPLLNRQFLVAPHTQYVAYFKEGNWWSYNISTMQKKCLTNNVNARFENTKPNYPYSVKHFEPMGWSANGKELLVYSDYDIWRIALDGSFTMALTDGRSDEKVFRHAVDKTLPKSFIAKSMFETKILSSEGKYVVTVYDQKKEEHTLYFINGTALSVISGFFKQQFNYNKLTDKAIVYKTESFNSSPYFVRHNLKSGKKWSSSRLIKTLNNGKTKVIALDDEEDLVKGALLYPKDYIPGGKYPLIVSIYEREAKEINRFSLPTLNNPTGFNPALYTQNGYFVLYPDLRYTHDNVLKTLVSDLEALLDKVIQEEPSVDGNKLGVIGHSFGGFQVMYAMGKTNRFKAAVAGAGISDLMDYYFTEHYKGGIGMFAFEFAQYRTNMPLGNANFMLNNPLSFAHQITTPFLLWSGTHDTQVHHRNSEKMYKALWRQKKEAYLVLYDKESHALEKESNRKDLTCRILNFFDAKLK